MVKFILKLLLKKAGLKRRNQKILSKKIKIFLKLNPILQEKQDFNKKPQERFRLVHFIEKISINNY